MIQLDALDPGGPARHAFFTRRGGVSEGQFASLNCGFGSRDERDKVARNREVAAGQLGLSADRLVTCLQIHGADVVTVTEPWAYPQNPRADAMVSRTPGIALGVLAADCAPILFLDPAAQVIGAAHGGWRGALAGVAEATVAAMTGLGARPERIRAAVGPCIAQASYEVGAEFNDAFVAAEPANADFFVSAPRAGHFLFDLPGYLLGRLKRLGLAAAEHTGHDTAAEEDLFFSYRRACLRGERDYGRGLAAIALTG